MMPTTRLNPLFALLLLAVGAFAAAPAGAEGADPHAGHDMATMGTAASNELQVDAVIHSVDAGKMVANVTHEAIPALAWPRMTMDLPVTTQVDVGAIKPDMKAVLTLKKGRDGQYRITAVKPTQ